MGLEVLTNLLEFKLPALAQTGVDTSSVRIVLFSRDGFRADLRRAADQRRDVDLVDLETLLSGTSTSSGASRRKA